MTAVRKIALVGPSFFSYIEAIRGKLRKRGFESEFFDERHSNSIVVKILYRIGFYEIVGARKNRHLDDLVACLRKEKFEDVLLIDVEVCDARFVSQLNAAGMRVYLYMWDSAKNKPRYLSYLDLLHGRSSFDPHDCVKYGLSYIPLFAEDVFSARCNAPAKAITRSVDVSFCGTLHSNRARRIRELLKVAARAKLKVALLLYFHSRVLLAVKSLVHFSNARFVNNVSTSGFSKQQIFELFVSSKFVLDLPHPGQIGLTARTFEALRSGTRVITFNRAARTMIPSSIVDRVFVVESADDIRRLDFIGACPENCLSENDDYFLSLNRFVDQILELMDLSRRPA